MGLLNDLFLLPALLLKFKPKFKSEPVPAATPAAGVQAEVEEGALG
jgi:hypothetical protein